MSDLEGNWIRKNRVALDLTVAEAADYAGISVAHLAQVETNRSRPSLPVLYHLAVFLNEDQLALKLWPFTQISPKPVPASQDETLF